MYKIGFVRKKIIFFHVPPLRVCAVEIGYIFCVLIKELKQCVYLCTLFYVLYSVHNCCEAIYLGHYCTNSYL